MTYYFKCPKCGKNDRFSPVDEGDQGTGCALLLFGGIVPALIYAGWRCGRVQCGHCHRIFQRPSPPSSGITRLAKSISAIAFLFSLAALIMITIPNESLPALESPWFQDLERMIIDHPRVIMYAILPLGPLLMLLCLIVALFSSGNDSRRLAERFRMEPDPSGPRKEIASSVAEGEPASK